MSYGTVRGTNANPPTDGLNDKSEESPLLSQNQSEQAPRSVWESLAFLWLTKLLKVGNEKQRLDPEDIDMVPLPKDCESNEVYERFTEIWNVELEKESPSMIIALTKAFGREYFVAGVLKFVHDCAVFVGPITLHGMIVFLRNEHAPIWHGIAWTLGVTISQILMSLCLRHYFFQCYKTGLRIRTAVAVAVYRKALLLSAAERQKRSAGEITNLMSIDAQRLQGKRETALFTSSKLTRFYTHNEDLTTYLHSLWSSPLQIALALFFLWRQLGPSSLGGVAVIVVMIPVTKLVAQSMASMQKTLMKKKDERVELNGEILAGMRVIKYQAWEEPYRERILNLRTDELNQVFWYAVANAFSRMLWVSTPLAVALATFTAYAMSGHVLDVASALTALTLFDILRFPLFMLPRIINSAVEAMISLRRIRSFLLCKEHVPVESNDLTETGVRLSNVSAVYESRRPVNASDDDWELSLLQSQLHNAETEILELKGEDKRTGVEQHNQSLLCLRRVRLECRPGEVVAVVGGVGCSKSSLVNSILGEVNVLAGDVSLCGTLAYFSQTPFILNATVRENILFGHPGETIDEELYQRALDCCALRHDLEILPDGEQTEIGERGITMSGGQKARIALARAVYHQADVTLVDDALSAVDAHVAKTIFEKALVGELMRPTSSGKARCVVIVTNAIQYLKHSSISRIVVLHEGRTVEEGTYEELANQKDSVFANFLSVISDTGVQQVEDSTPTQSSAQEAATNLNVTVTNTVADSTKKTTTRLVSAETREKGNISAATYFAWARAAGGRFFVPVAIVTAFCISEAGQFAANWWITYWSGHGNNESQFKFLRIYALINLSTVCIGLGRMLLLTYFGYRASKHLFVDMLNVVLHARMSFFDTTPVGRLVNRFSKDTYTIDESLLVTLSGYLSTLFTVLSTIVVISGITPTFTICLLPMIFYYLAEQKFFTSSYRELKRLDSVSRSPLYALLSETIDGVVVIRAFSAQNSLIQRLLKMLNRQQHAYFLTFSGQSWLAVRLEMVGTLIITFTCLSAVAEHITSGSSEQFAGLAGLAISYSLSVTQSLNWSVRMASDMEANMIAVERVIEYTTLLSEGQRHQSIDSTLPEAWPLKGSISFDNVQFRYRPELPLVLKGLTLQIPGGSKIGVVGRTGAGKSTIMVALMRMIDICGGKILIDGTETKSLGLAKLRKAVAVIPQDPILFSGSVRTNLDPFDTYDDESLYVALEKVGLSKTLSDSTHSTGPKVARIESLHDPVAEGGTNFSVGQRQLLVIARALLRSAKIIVMDEATASVDAETDALIQRAFRKVFVNATCITVAHRINTIMDSDYILVMDDGMATEFDSPSVLLQRGGMFRDLVNASAHE